MGGEEWWYLVEGVEECVYDVSVCSCLVWWWGIWISVCVLFFFLFVIRLVGVVFVMICLVFIMSMWFVSSNVFVMLCVMRMVVRLSWLWRL